MAEMIKNEFCLLPRFKKVASFEDWFFTEGGARSTRGVGGVAVLIRGGGVFKGHTTKPWSINGFGDTKTQLTLKGLRGSAKLHRDGRGAGGGGVWPGKDHTQLIVSSKMAPSGKNEEREEYRRGRRGRSQWQGAGR